VSFKAVVSEFVFCTRLCIRGSILGVNAFYWRVPALCRTLTGGDVVPACRQAGSSLYSASSWWQPSGYHCDRARGRCLTERVTPFHAIDRLGLHIRAEPRAFRSAQGQQPSIRTRACRSLRFGQSKCLGVAAACTRGSAPWKAPDRMRCATLLPNNFNNGIPTAQCLGFPKWPWPFPE